jgi:hypothetical protein
MYPRPALSPACRTHLFLEEFIISSTEQGTNKSVDMRAIIGPRIETEIPQVDNLLYIPPRIPLEDGRVMRLLPLDTIYIETASTYLSTQKIDRGQASQLKQSMIGLLYNMATDQIKALENELLEKSGKEIILEQLLAISVAQNKVVLVV